MASSKAFGGTGKGDNPEQLLASSYSSCFLGALQYCAAQAGNHGTARNAKVHANVYLGHPSPRLGLDGAKLEGAATGLKVELVVEGVEDDGIIRAAHGMCPYSIAFKEGIEVGLRKE